MSNSQSNLQRPELVGEIDTFIEKTGMAPSYLGKKAVGNSEIVTRLRAGGRCFPETESALRQFMADHLAKIEAEG
jgi:hypothetical protein